MPSDPNPRTSARLTVVPVELAEANAFVAAHHRHHRPTVGHRFSIGANRDGRIVGVAIVGRPTSRGLQDGWTCEVTRLATDGTANACSVLYAAAWRACRAMGYRRLVTYTLPEEGGTSLRASGFRLIGEAGGGVVVVPVSAARRQAPATAQVALGNRSG